MPETYFIRITPRALADLQSIFDFIRTDSPQNAAKMIRTIMDSIDKLEIFPHRHAVPRGEILDNRDIRSMVVRPYLVRYRIDENRRVVYILRVRHGASQ